MKRVKQPILLSIALGMVMSSVAFSQISSTSLQGTATDPSGSAVSGATVVLANSESKLERTMDTGMQGEYRFIALPPGTYTLTVTAKGFSRYQQTDLQLLVNTPATANVRLKVGSVTESVNVTGEAPALNLVDASIGNPFNETQVKQLPLDGRNVPDLLSLQAGVTTIGNGAHLDDPRVKDQDTRNGAVNGARSDQSNITLDGVDVNDQSNGYAFTSVLPITPDSVQEFRVTTSNYNADQGEGSGAQVSLITKSGTKSFHGSIYEYHRNTITSANDYFVKAAEVGNGQPNVPDKLIRNNFGVSLGGPIRKDRFFFFVNYEGQRRREEESTVRAIPTPSLCNGIIQYTDVNAGTTAIHAAQLALLDPQGAGINKAIENPSDPLNPGYFDRTFCSGQFATNDPSVGDGFNYSGFRFRAPVKLDNNIFIAKLDYHITADGRHTMFWRGALQNVFNPQAPFLPGDRPEQIVTDHSKGFVVGYTAVLNPTMVNTFHYGFTRQSTGFTGNSDTKEWNVFYGLDEGFVYSHNSQAPTHNFLDDFSWTKGKHTLQFGGNVGIVRDPRVSLEHSFSLGKGATNWMSPTGFANTATHAPGSLDCPAVGAPGGGSPLDPCHAIDPNTGQPFAEPASTFAFDYPALGLIGMVSDIVANYNYDKQLQPLAKGIPVRRKYGLEWYEFYGQDSWRIKPNLTVTFGVRWSLFPPPWEVNGFQASPDVNLGQQFDQLTRNMKQGLGYDQIPLLSFVKGGPANNGRGWYSFEKSDFSPRFSFAYSPRPSGAGVRSIFGEGDKTVIRGGFSKVYDRAGMQMLSTFVANPPGGFGATIQNFCCTPGYDDAAHVPRISDINTIPTCGPVDNCSGAGNQVFFQPPPPAMNPPAGLQAITWGLDQSIKTPHAWAIDFSIGRELPKKFSFQVAYVGRLGRNLLTQRDLRQPLDIVDPKTGIDYFSAATALAKVAMAQLAACSSPPNPPCINPAAVTDAVVDAVGKPTSAYWHDMLPTLQAGAVNYTSYSGFQSSSGNAGLIQSVYDLYYDPSLSYVGNEVVG